MVTIDCNMKDGSTVLYLWQDKQFAWICFQFIRELQEDLENKKVRYISVYDRDTQEVYMKKGLKTCQWPREQWRKERGNYIINYNA